MERQNTSPSVPYMQVRHSLRSRIEYISPVADCLMSLIGSCRAADGSEVDIEIALREALTNAMVHGNHGDPEKHVDIVCRCGLNGAVDLTIHDEGQGFDSRALPDPTAGQNRMSAHGRGVYLMRALMDEVHYRDGGTTLHMRKNPIRNTTERFTDKTPSGPNPGALQGARR